MSSSLSSLHNLVPKLDPTNYHTWKTKMEMVLIQERLWSIVSERRTRPESGIVRQTEWDDEAEQATAIIFLCLSESAERHVQDLRNPVEIWKTLKKVYEVRGFSARFILWRNLFSLRLGESMTSYIDELTSLRQQLESAGSTVPDEIIASVLLNGLDQSWESFISARTQAYTTIDPDELINQLLHEDRCKKATPITGSPDTQALAVQNNGRKRNRPRPHFRDYHSRDRM